MSRIVSTWLKSRNELVVQMDGLSYEGENGMDFVLIWNYRDISTAHSYNSGGEANVIFDVSSVPEGSQYFEVKRIMSSTGNRYLVGSGFTKYIGSGSIIDPDDPPQPTAHQMTQIKITNISYAETNAFRISWKCNGYGRVRFESATRAQDGSYSLLHEVYVGERDLDSSGWYYTSDTISTGGSVYRADLSVFGQLPLGSVQLIGEYNNNVGYTPESKPFLCINTYNFTSYTGTYYATIQYSPLYSGGYNYQDPRIAVTSFGSLTDEWTTLVNLFYYLEATTYGRLRYSTYSSYIPARGDIITASMYNALMDSAESCARQCGVWTSFPAKVSSGQIIPNNFISRLGDIANACIEKQKNKSNSRAIEY